MKVFFIAQYKYLHYKPFARIIKELEASGTEAYFVNVKNMTFVKKYDEEKYSKDLFEKDGIPFKELELYDNDFNSNLFLKRTIVALLTKTKYKSMKRFLQIYLSKMKILHFLLIQRPQIIVIGSDLGGLYIRIIQDYCERLKIRVVIVNTHPNRPKSEEILREIPKKRLWLVRILGIAKALYFSKRVMGSYLQNSLISVPGEVVKQNLIEEGIDSNRIFMTGNPLHDEVFEQIKNAQNSVSKLKDSLQIKHDKVLVYFSSMAHEKYGLDYLNRLNATIKNTINDMDITLFVKFHPRESDEIKELYKNTFGFKKVLYDTNSCDAIQLILLSDNLITDTGSSIVPQALLAGKKCLILNLVGDQCPYKISEDFLISNENELVQELRKMTNFDNQQIDTANLGKVILDNFYQFDGKCSKRCAQLIIGELGQ